jgi:membrane protease YdiL (CAAX protease family)
MKPIIAWIKRHPLVTFFALASGFSWAAWILVRLSPVFDAILNPSLGPLLAALLASALIGGRAEVRAWWQRASRWRGGLGWYALALLLPLAINGAAAALAVLLGAPLPTAALIAGWPALFINLLIYLVLGGPLGEEPGWRGFAMSRLQMGRSALAASLILGILVVGWHLPLVLTGQQPAVVLLATFAAQFIYTWLANRTNGSVLIVMLAHAAQGASGSYFGPMFSGASATLQTGLLVALYVAVALVVVRLAGPNLGQKPAVQLEAAQSAPAVG